MIAMVAPSLSCCDHTLNTLRYAQRVKQLTPIETWPRITSVNRPLRSFGCHRNQQKAGFGSTPTTPRNRRGVDHRNSNFIENIDEELNDGAEVSLKYCVLLT